MRNSLACFILIFIPVYAPAESPQTYEIGLQVSGLHLHKIDETPVGLGVRFHYNLTRILAADAELTHYPENPSGNFGETAALAGFRGGKRFGRVGIFAKLRPGEMHFGGEFFSLRLDTKTHFMLDIGGVVEYYPSKRTFIRIDAGDAVIYYGSARFFNRPNPDALGTVHNFQPALGFGFRF